MLGYHGTQTRLVRKIMKEGLIPQVPHPETLRDPDDLHTAFYRDFDTALDSWLGTSTVPGLTDVTILEVDLSNFSPAIIFDEMVIYGRIPPKYIRPIARLVRGEQVPLKRP